MHILRVALFAAAFKRLRKGPFEGPATIKPPALRRIFTITGFTPKALAAFVGLSPGDHSSGTSVRRPGKISRIGTERLRSTLYMCALSAKRNNKPLAAFIARMSAAGKPPKVILIAVARKLLVYAHAVIRTQKAFDSSPDAPLPA